MLRIFALIAAFAWASQLNAAQSVVRQVSNVAFEADNPWDLPYFQAPAIYDNELYFSASTDDKETRLFATDGRRVRSFNVSPGHSVGSQSIEFQGQLYFRGDDGHGIEPFTTDGHTLTNLDLSQTPEGSWPYNFNVVGDSLYFQGGLFDAAGNVQAYMFHTDGNEVTTLANTSTSDSYPWGSAAGGKFYFPANGPDGFELYRAEGRAIQQVIDVNPGLNGSSPWPAGELNGEFYFTAVGPEGRGLYRTEGEGAIQLPFPPDPSQSGGPVNFVRFGEALYFQGKGEDGYELYRTDGDSVTHLDLLPGPESSGAATYAGAESGGKLMVPGRGPNGWAIFIVNSDGELANRIDLGQIPYPVTPGMPHLEALVQDQKRGFYDSWPRELREFQGEVYFEGTGPTGPDLYKTDGQTLTKFNLVPESGSLNRGVGLYGAQSLAGSLYFIATTEMGVELVRTDGSTTSIIDLASGGESSYPRQLELIGEELVFQTHFAESTVIYATDGTSMRRLAEFPDMAIDTGYGYVENVNSTTDFLRLGDALFFLGRTEQGWRLHRIGAIPEPSGLMLVIVPTLLASVLRRPFRARRHERMPPAAAPPR
ncbi:hypothetical protein [Lacipirellula sp.]|uniref:hypothetical protein n=1 Tax=Lacipirellula sp. TaxID=2691419 RepID=UPI003D139713